MGSITKMKGVSLGRVENATEFLDDLNAHIEKGTITLAALLTLAKVVVGAFRRDGTLTLQQKADLIYNAGVRIEEAGVRWFEAHPEYDPATGDRRA